MRLSEMDEYLELLADLSVPEDYDDIDRYNDFRKVFLEDEPGRRVLKQILGWGGLLKIHPMRSPIDSAMTERLEGQRNLSLKIFAIMLVEPKKRPDKQATIPKEE